MTADSIEINWVSPDTTSLYWSGSFTRPPPPTATLGPARDTRTKCRRACSPHRTTPKISSMKTVKSPTRPARWAPQPPFTSRSSKNHPYNPPPPEGVGIVFENSYPRNVIHKRISKVRSAFPMQVRSCQRCESESRRYLHLERIQRQKSHRNG